MNNEERDEVLMRLIEQPDAREEILKSCDSDADRDEILRLLQVADLTWLSAQEAPVLEADPVAAMLGLVPESDCRLDPSALSRARKKARMSVSQIAERLRQRGWEFKTSDVFRWETRIAADVPPAVIQALSEILETVTEKLISTLAAAEIPEDLLSVRESSLFADLVARWSQAVHVSRSVAAAMLESRMLATVHRGDQPDAEQLLRSLETLVTSVETRAENE